MRDPSKHRPLCDSKGSIFMDLFTLHLVPHIDHFQNCVPVVNLLLWSAWLIYCSIVFCGSEALPGYCYHLVSTNYNNEWQSQKSNTNLLDFKANDHSPFAVLTVSPHGLANSWQSFYPSLGFQGMEFGHL